MEAAYDMDLLCADWLDENELWDHQLEHFAIMVTSNIEEVTCPKCKQMMRDEYVKSLEKICEEKHDR